MEREKNSVMYSFSEKNNSKHRPIRQLSNCLKKIFVVPPY